MLADEPLATHERQAVTVVEQVDLTSSRPSAVAGSSAPAVTAREVGGAGMQVAYLPARSCPEA